MEEMKDRNRIWWDELDQWEGVILIGIVTYTTCEQAWRYRFFLFALRSNLFWFSGYCRSLMKTNPWTEEELLLLASINQRSSGKFPPQDWIYTVSMGSICSLSNGIMFIHTKIDMNYFIMQRNILENLNVKVVHFKK